MDGIETPTIERYLQINAREAAMAHREFKEEYKAWLEAYKNHDVLRIQELARKRDLKARKASRACHRADRFLVGIGGLWKVSYHRS